MNSHKNVSSTRSLSNTVLQSRQALVCKYSCMSSILKTCGLVQSQTVLKLFLPIEWPEACLLLVINDTG